MINKHESFERFHEFARKWVARVEDSRGCWAGSDELRTSIMKSWKTDMYDQLIVDMTCSREDGGQRRVVERWTIQYIPEQSKNYITTYNSLEKRLSVLTRTVYSVARLLPVYNFRRYVPRNMSSCMYCASNSAPGDQFLPIPAEMRKFYSFPRIPLAWGSISVAVEYLTSVGLQELVLLKVADSIDSRSKHSPQVARPPATDSLQQTRRLSGVVAAPSSGPVRIPEPYSSADTPEVEVAGARPRTQSLHSFSPDMQHVPFGGQRTSPGDPPSVGSAPRDTGCVPYHGAAPIAASAVAANFLNRSYAADGFNPVTAAPMMSRSLDSKPSHFGPSTFYPATHGITSPAQILGPNRDISQMSELASSYNSSSSGGDAMAMHATSYGANSPSTNMFPSVPGTSPPQQGNWGGVDILSSSPLTGPGATFQSLRGRPSSFDHGRSFGPDSGVTGYFQSAGASAANVVNTTTVLFDDLPPSPFIAEGDDHAPGYGDSTLRGPFSRRESDENTIQGTVDYPGNEDSEDDEEDDMMFKLDGATTRVEKSKPATVMACSEDIITLSQHISNLPNLSSFPSVNSYENSVETLQSLQRNS